MCPLIQNCTVYDYTYELGLFVSFTSTESNNPAGEYLRKHTGKNKWVPAYPAFQTYKGNHYLIVSAFMVNDKDELSEARILKRYDVACDAIMDAKRLCELLNR